jgi:hypothetical protein
MVKVALRAALIVDVGLEVTTVVAVLAKPVAVPDGTEGKAVAAVMGPAFTLI